MVELCVIITSPHGGAPDEVTLSVTTRDHTAGNNVHMVHTCYNCVHSMSLLAVAGHDYAAVVSDELVFRHGENRVCYTVNIQQDYVCENISNEQFFSDLAYVSGLQPVIDPSTVLVFIDDTKEQECSKYLLYYSYSCPYNNGREQVDLLDCHRNSLSCVSVFCMFGSVCFCNRVYYYW